MTDRNAGEGKLEVKMMFEPNRLQHESLAAAYEQVVPTLSRTMEPGSRSVAVEGRNSAIAAQAGRR